MLNLFTNGRTSWVGDLKVETKTGTDGKPYEAKSILFKVASNREYSVEKVVNGVKVKERPADFILCKAFGAAAQLIADHASERDAAGKLVSRFLEIRGHVELFQTTKKVPVEKDVKIGDKTYKIQFEATVPVESSIVIIEHINFLDSAGTKARVLEATSSTEMTITEVTDSAPVAAPATEASAPAPGIPVSDAELIGSIEEIEVGLPLGAEQAPF